MAEAHNTNSVWFFFRKSMLGGLVILLPISIIAFFFHWLYKTITGLIEPFTRLIVHYFGLPEPAAAWLIVALIVVVCFVIGTLVATRIGGWLWGQLEDRTIARLPGYRTVKEVVTQLFGDNPDSPFRHGEVAQVWLYGRQVETTVLGLITSPHDDGVFTVFVPTGPNPTSGFIYHVHGGLVDRRPDIPVEDMMKTVVACGAGSARLLRRKVS